VIRNLLDRAWGAMQSGLQRRRWCHQRGNLRLSGKAKLRVTYAHSAFPDQLNEHGKIIGGGAVKYSLLDTVFPHGGLEADVLYAVSSSHFPYLLKLIEAAQQVGMPFVWNQNGAYFPSAYGAKIAAQGNVQMARCLHAADVVLYQSEFARTASDYFLGVCCGRSEVLYNAVDTERFVPKNNKLDGELILLTAGSHNDAYRLPLAIETLARVRRSWPASRLIVAGRASAVRMREVNSLVCEKHLDDVVEFVGGYSQQEAAMLFGRSHILLHTQYNDVCPSVVLEAMACGLPVVCSKSGGTPELVGEEAGVCVPAVLDWETPRPPSADALAEGVLIVAQAWLDFREAARRRAVMMFDLRQWLSRHEKIFNELMVGNKQ
jgi:glycosyltransferase involved in cell wall biosynthesis